ncbi:MAG: cellulase family glycosylhydrolase [Chloroflexota bacterium]
MLALLGAVVLLASLGASTSLIFAEPCPRGPQADRYGCAADTSPDPPSTAPSRAAIRAAETPAAGPGSLSRDRKALPGFVSRQQTKLMLDGQQFRFVGANMYNAAGDPGIYECGPYMSDPDRDLDDWFRRAKTEFGATAVRFWAFQRYTRGGADWRSLDRVFRLARAHNLKVIPVLENQWADCSRGTARLDTWYAGGYKQPYGGYTLSYKDYVGRVVSRYANEPSILAWSLMNEAESRTSGGSPSPDPLYQFANDMSAYVKALDSNHLVTLGVIGGNQPGVSGTNYERLHGISTIDFAEFHDYGANDQALPGAPSFRQSDLNTGIYTQDAAWVWRAGTYIQNRARTWETLTMTVPAGTGPFQRIGVNMYGAPGGSVYVDRVTIGSRVFDFESGSLDGWSASTGVTLALSSNVVYSGSRSLRLTFSGATSGAQIWIPGSAVDVPGTPITFRIYVDTAGTIAPPNTLAAAIAKAAELGKPIVVGESGMTVCASDAGSQVETLQSRASKMGAKMTAFFAQGGSGYLIWAWEPVLSCSYRFTSGDPLNTVLLSQAGALKQTGSTGTNPDRRR